MKTCLHPSCDVDSLDKYAPQGCSHTTTLSEGSLDLEIPTHDDDVCKADRAASWSIPEYPYVLGFCEACHNGMREASVYEELHAACEVGGGKYELVDEIIKCPWHDPITAIHAIHTVTLLPVS